MPRRAAVLVTGGAGYVGAAVVRALARAGCRPVVVDDLSTGHRGALPGVPLLRARCGDARRLGPFLRRHSVRAAVHAAASCLVAESVRDPARYYSNNLAEGLALLEVLRRAGIRQIIFSSSAAVYGEPESVPVAEDHPLRPVNPYGETKAAFERALAWYCRAYRLTAVALRFFNASGADERGEHGEDHDPETHLVPRLLRQALRARPQVEVFGTDFPTPDGSALRDFVHVDDLAQAHLRALERCREPGRFSAYNLGTGTGTTVREVVRVAERVTGRALCVLEQPRRPGDPARLVASNARARAELGWEPSRTLEAILRSSWKWHSTHPRGYRGAVRLVSPERGVLRSRQGARGG